MMARTTSSSCTNCTRGSKPNTAGTRGSASARVMGVTMSDPSTLEKRSVVTATWVVDRVVPHVGLDLDERALDGDGPTTSAGVLGEPHRIAVGRPVDQRRRLQHHVGHPALGLARSGEQVHRADDVGLVHRPLRSPGRVDHQEGVQDRVDLGCTHDARQDRVALVGAYVLRPIELDRGLAGVESTITSTLGSASRAWATRPPQKVPSPVTSTPSHRSGRSSPRP